MLWTDSILNKKSDCVASPGIRGRRKFYMAKDTTYVDFVPGEMIAESAEFEEVIIGYSKDKRIVTLGILDAVIHTTRDSLVDLLNLMIDKEEVAT